MGKIYSPLLRNNEFKNLDKKQIKKFFHIFGKNELKKKFKKNIREESFIKNVLKNKMANEFFYQTLPLALHEDDLNSMFYSIENRSPFLNRSLVEFCFSLESKHFMKDSFNKYLLRKNSKNILKDKIRLNREKKDLMHLLIVYFHSVTKNSKNGFLKKVVQYFNWLIEKSF